MIDKENCHCNEEYCCNDNNKVIFAQKILQVLKLGEAAVNAVVKVWNKFEVSEYVPDREFLDNYSCDVELDLNPDWVLWEMEMK
jgi:hypothetical protein